MDHPPSSASGPSETGDRAQIATSYDFVQKWAPRLTCRCSECRQEVVQDVESVLAEQAAKVRDLQLSLSHWLNRHDYLADLLTAQAAKLEAAERLIAKWRESYLCSAQISYAYCARELEAALSSVSARPAEEQPTSLAESLDEGTL